MAHADCVTVFGARHGWPCCNGRLDIKLVEASLDSRDMSVWFVSHAIGKLANRKLCPRKAKPKHQLSLVL